MEDKRLRLAVRELVEFILRSGDIDSRYTPRNRMAEGARMHRTLQKRNKERCESYMSEVTLSAELSCRGVTYVLEGRADGILTDGDRTVVDEIKTTTLPPELIDEEFSRTHWAQGQCYAFIVAGQRALEEIAVQLTYANVDTGHTKCFQRTYDRADLTRFVEELLEKYADWAQLSADWQALRDASVRALAFPFPAYRRGQRELAVRVYRTISGGRKLYAQAPTGIGKTVSALYPAVKAMGEGKTSKLFYLTAKTVTRQVAEEAFDRMRQGGLRMKTLTLTAKEKICFCENTVCRPEVCPYARGYYDRANSAVYDILTSCDAITRSVVEEYAVKHGVCPFELSLDIALWVDCVICDYNYVFDPRAYLRRFFAEGPRDFVFLVDEAHNLVDRSREMFSASVTKAQFYALKKRVKGGKALAKAFTAVNKRMLEYRKACLDTGFFVTPEKQEGLIDELNAFIAVCETLLKEDGAFAEDNEFLQLYFDALNFALIAEFYDERYVTYVETQAGDVVVRLFCLDPSFLLREALRRGASAVLFSATLTPLEYFRDILGGDAGDELVALESPFDSERLCLLAADRISTRFKHREESAGRIAGLIGAFVSRRTGNYIVYFPSYKYLKDVYVRFAGAFPHIRTVQQGVSMTEEEREAFLALFVEAPENTLVAFCVLGGIFSEGIDLTGSRLIGSVIVSVGLPQLSVQQNVIRGYFDKKNGMGFEYAYMYPGMNKVLQAAGRVIRSETDAGAVLLVDERFGQRSYARLFPGHWNGLRRVGDAGRLEAALDAFWADIDQE